MQGGSFESGAITGAVSAGASLLMAGTGVLGQPGDRNGGLMLARTAVAAAVGGTASVLSGGKFANGAITGAMGHLFNAEKILERGKMFGRTYGIHSNGRCCFSSMSAATSALEGVIASHRAGSGAPEYEIGATIYKTADGTFGYNDVVTYFSPNSVAPFENVPGGGKPVGYIHNHPEPSWLNKWLGYDGEYFSDADLDAVAIGRAKFGEDYKGYVVTPSAKLLEAN
jgi:Domain of unknown function (DUF4329)